LKGPPRCAVRCCSRTEEQRVATTLRRFHERGEYLSVTVSCSPRWRLFCALLPEYTCVSSYFHTISVQNIAFTLFSAALGSFPLHIFVYVRQRSVAVYRALFLSFYCTFLLICSFFHTHDQPII